MTKADFSAVSNLLNDCYMYLPDIYNLDVGSPEYIIYHLVLLAEVIADLNNK